jgi:hypothetical protein
MATARFSVNQRTVFTGMCVFNMRLLTLHNGSRITKGALFVMTGLLMSVGKNWGSSGY